MQYYNINFIINIITKTIDVPIPPSNGFKHKKNYILYIIGQFLCLEMLFSFFELYIIISDGHYRIVFDSSFKLLTLYSNSFT